jgi:hypothetical protein
LRKEGNNTDRRQMEEFYYAAINNLLKDNTTGVATSTKLN